ncbi:hypothetical protein N0V84_002371 [Fusarium piperis]|uniref:Chromate transport protein n=1 Tax=Fusarium piperis TaxID=1435070 RepID=A0A9W9BS73_9HYPO|nr:hypothetical protein N0V84_002371 [Fusarium piperis]
MAIRSAQLNTANLGGRFWNTIRENWYLGFTSFGGPPVHFKIYQELFSVCQAFSGPGSTKMHYCINLIHDGFLPALLGFLIWRAVYALLSGLNAATVGIIVLAAVQLSEKAATDTMTRILVFLGAAAGLMYNALWYFPLLMFLAGLTAVAHDFRWFHSPVKSIVAAFKREARHSSEDAIEMQIQQEAAARHDDQQSHERGTLPVTAQDTSTAEEEPRVVPHERRLSIGWRFGLFLIVLFLISFILVMVLRGTLPNKPLLYSLFANMYLAGTIIFGGGPVVIPLLREYIVAENWVSPRDFLIGLALIQAFPGPNFNFAVYLGSLTAINGGFNSAAGAVLGFLGIFVPGLMTVHGTMGVWGAIRGWRWVKSSLRGVNAAAVGLIYTAVYRLWQIGYIDQGFQQGTSLAVEPWWVVVTATGYVGGYWFRVSPPVAIVTGAIMGLIWYGVVSS